MPDRRVLPWEVYWADLDPQVGREQIGRRPVIVVGSALACSLPNGLVIVVPCTSTDRGLPFQPRIELAGREGFALCDQIKALSVARLVNRHQARRLAPEFWPVVQRSVRAMLA